MQTLVASLLAALLQVPPSPAPLPSTSPTPVVSPSPVVSPTPAAQLSAQPFVADHLYPGGVLPITIANSTGPISASIDNPIVSWNIDQNARTVTLTAGQTLGRGVLTISDGSGQRVLIPVRVAVDAAKVLTQTLTLQYTGNPVDPAWLQRVLQRSVLRNVQVQPGLQPQTRFNLPTLAPGSIGAFDAQVQVPGNDSTYPVSAVVNVNLQNVDAQAFTPPVLFYDDDPEHITSEGVLYRGHITPGTPVRLYYYHDNNAQPRDLAVVFSAPSGASTVQLIDASAGPNIDVMQVGHAVTRDFLDRKPINEGIVTTIDSETPYVAERFSMQPLNGVAGNIDVHILSGGALDVTVLSLAENTPDANIPGLLTGPKLPGDGHHRTGVFNINGYAQDTLAYRVGGDDVSLDYGLHSPPTIDPPDGRDFGEYGVWRTLSFNVTNPTGQPATLYLYEQPMGGPVRSSFLINGVPPLADIQCARASERYQIAPVAAQPGATTIQLQTMTDGGSFYPLEVGLTATPPSPNPPPISAPNGCFPKPQALPQASPLPAASPIPEPAGR
ncbi:MAG TPA: hypothetical protein VFW34_10665 [Candidatus Rubrimentiphilum sp.]|nr:hypothetical protein [Candidatus Rubrimentiphilum sp.]